MAPANSPQRDSLSVAGQILEAWSSGWNVGGLIVLLLIVFSNYRRRNTLHKLILLEVGSNNVVHPGEHLAHVYITSWFLLWGMEHSYSHL